MVRRNRKGGSHFMNVAIYTRVSTVEQARDGYSLAAQEKLLREYCKMKKYDVIEVYSDEGISGGTIEKRPGMNKLLEDARMNKFDIILVWKLTRFSRSLKDILNTCDELEKIGIYLESYSESFDSKTPAGRLTRGLLGLVGQFEREVLSENVSMGLNERAMRGLHTCTNILGYEIISKNELAINKKEAELVRFLFNTYLERKSLLELEQLCSQLDYVGKRGQCLRAQSVYTILKNPVYAGFNRWNGDLIRGCHKPIISIEIFNKVQLLLRRQGKSTGRKRKNDLVLLKKAVE